MKARIYHNPRCSKSRATKELLESKNIEFEVIEYLKTPPDAETLIRLSVKLGLSAKDFFRANEPEFKKDKIDPATLSELALIDLMVKSPKLIERPIVEVDDAARIGRPPERVLELFK
jgi:arsenate reductase